MPYLQQSERREYMPTHAPARTQHHKTAWFETATLINDIFDELTHISPQSCVTDDDIARTLRDTIRTLRFTMLLAKRHGAQREAVEAMLFNEAVELFALIASIRYRLPPSQD